MISARSGFAVAGHGRLAAARLLGLDAVPVDLQPFETEADEWAHLIADNRIAELADIDTGGLVELLRELGEMEDFDIELTGFVEADVDKLLGEDEEADDIAEDADSSEPCILLKFDGLSIPLTEAERAEPRRRLDLHTEVAGSYFGYVQQLLGMEDEDV